MSPDKPVLIYASTNKVYGKMDNLEVIKQKNRYTYKKLKTGVSENMNIDFYSPYGCSKGCGNQICKRLFKNIWFENCCVQAILYLRRKTIRN